MLRASGIPVVEIMDVDGTPIDSVVGISHRRAGQQMAQAIIRAGYRRIGFMGTKMPLDHRARKRFEGFTEALAKAGIEMADHEFYSGGSVSRIVELQSIERANFSSSHFAIPGGYSRESMTETR